MFTNIDPVARLRAVYAPRGCLGEGLATPGESVIAVECAFIGNRPAGPLNFWTKFADNSGSSSVMGMKAS
jgi:hypothetical protein